MDTVLLQKASNVAKITLHRPQKSNAFDEVLLRALLQALQNAIADPRVFVILLQAEGKHFSAGADVSWMQKSLYYSEEENIQDAQILAKVLYTLYQSPKPTIAAVQGAAFGGGAGLIAACDIAIAADNTRISFSEVKLGLVPAVISPYVIQAIGARKASFLFMTAKELQAEEAFAYGLVQVVTSLATLQETAEDYAHMLTQRAREAVIESKRLVREMAAEKIQEDLMLKTASILAKKRVSQEAQQGLRAFLAKTPPPWEV